jgi:DNA-binding GntR family transcriptional regulator
MYTSPDTPSSGSESLRETAYSVLRRRMLEGEFPLGHRLGEGRLADELGMSRTPVREALAALRAEGLVERHPDGGYAPATPDLDSIPDLYEVRAALEVEAVALPSRRGGQHQAELLEAVQEEWRELRANPPAASPSFVSLDEAFHVGIAHAAGNHALVKTLEQVNDRIRFVRMQDFLTDERVEVTIREHLEIVDALLERDQFEAAARLRRHLEESMAVVEQRALQALARMVVGQLGGDSSSWPLPRESEAHQEETS